MPLDVAATEFFTEGTGYSFEKETRTDMQMIEFYAGLIDSYRNRNRETFVNRKD